MLYHSSPPECDICLSVLFYWRISIWATEIMQTWCAADQCRQLLQPGELCKSLDWDTVLGSFLQLACMLSLLDQCLVLTLEDVLPI
jgi:hypothetical protein